MECCCSPNFCRYTFGPAFLFIECQNEAMMIKWRKQYAEPARDEELGDMSAVYFPEGDDRTVQSFKDDSDINTIMRRFGVTGEMPRASMEPFYGDFSEAVDYQTAMNMIREAGDAFASLPSGIRRRFGHDPAELMEFLKDPANRAEAEDLGLVDRRPPEPPAAPEPAAEEGGA